MKREELEARIGNCIHKEDGRRDFLPLYADPDVMREIVAALSEPYRGKVDFVVSPEPMGLILGSMLARELGVGFVALRKGREGKRHWEDSILAPYIDHRDQVQTLELESGLIPAGSRILLADDWVGTAATVQAARNLIDEAAVVLVGTVCLGADYHSAARGMLDSGAISCLLCRKE